MKSSKNLFLLLIVTVLTLGCAEDNDDLPASGNEVKDFIYRGMNTYYLYKANIDVLDDNRFTNNNQLEDYYQQFPTPTAFFESLIYKRQEVDRFSIIVEDYVELEQLLSGNTLNNGLEYGLVRNRTESEKVFGYVRYVMPNSDAATTSLSRGQIFSGVDGIQLTTSNFRTLLSQTTYTLNLADFNNGDPQSNGNSIELTKTQLQEDPILIDKVIETGNSKVGYLLYNSFLRDYDDRLNDVFANFKSQGVTHLVLDLRYNSGGSVNSAITLGSLISGNPTSDVFSTEQWNPQIQDFLMQNNPEQLINRFKSSTSSGSPLNSLNLDKVYILTTRSSASASELVINSLDPYINVVQIGENTAGKYQASITLYDSEDFRRSQANNSHRYAMQPLVLKSLNSVGKTDYFNGLDPDIELREDFGNLGTLGDPSEPLLQASLNDIENLGRIIAPSNYNKSLPSLEFYDSNQMRPLDVGMWIDDPIAPIN